MSDKSAMPVSKALDFADEWTKGTTFYPGADGWRVVCATLAAEVRRLRGDHIECHQGRDIIESLAQAISEIPCCGIMGILAAATQEIDALRSGEFICKKCGLRKDADNFFGEIPF